MVDHDLESCFICRKHAGLEKIPGGAIYADDLLYVGHAQVREGEPTAYLGYLMVEPRRHVPGLDGLSRHEAAAIGWMATRVAGGLKATEGADHVYAFVLGHHVPHLHVHIVPRYPGAPREFWGVHVDEWPHAPRGAAREIEGVCERLRTYLRTTEDEEVKDEPAGTF